MNRYECEGCGLAAMDLPDDVDPELGQDVIAHVTDELLAVLRGGASC